MLFTLEPYQFSSFIKPETNTSAAVCSVVTCLLDHTHDAGTGGGIEVA